MNADAAREGGRLRLTYLDGLRGIAALWVVFHHAFVEVAAFKGWLPTGWQKWTCWAWDGQIGVQIFITLSGYCLMLPVARAGHLKGGVPGFLARRARRILPPYYAALALALAVIAFVPGMGILHGVRWDVTLPAFSPSVLISHLLLVQDLDQDWVSKIDFPMWTISQEWQLYFVFALVLLPLWRRAGMVVTLVAALAVSLALRRPPGGYYFGYACPEFLFLFTVGMAAAVVNFAPSNGRFAAWVGRTSWGWWTAGCWAVYVVCTLVQKDPALYYSTRFTLLAAPPVFCTLVYCTRSAQSGRGGNFLLRLCERDAAVVLGTFSYSLYLVHEPVLAMTTLALRHWQTPGPAAVAVQLLVAVPVAAIFSYGFHLVAERPFLLGRPATLARAEKAAILDPAP